MRIGVIGAGSWGTTLAVLLSENSHETTLWSISEDDVHIMRSTRRNGHFLPELALPERLEITSSVSETASDKDMLVLATPAQYLRNTLRLAAPFMSATAIIVNVAKGIEENTLFRMSQVVEDVLPRREPGLYSVLSGPSHAEEVSVRKATSVVAASVDPNTALAVQKAFMTPYFRVYGSSDVIGVELGGSVKNVIAIGAGICDGAGFGDNTKAALITRGIAEIRRLGISLGADPHTFAGLSGLGDLIVTTMSRHSRNRHVGEQLGMGLPLSDVLSSMSMVAEGVATTRSALQLGRSQAVEMPITEQVYRVLFEGLEITNALEELMTRQARDETW